MAKKDYYEVLGLSRGASPDDIKKAYKKMALQYHPDRNPDNKEAEERFKECSEAYEVLSNADKRAAYDRFGHAGVGAAPGYEGGGFSGDFQGGNFSEIFEDFFGDVFGVGGRGRRRPQRGSDLQYRIRIKFEEAVFGAEKSIDITRDDRCDTCTGTGAKPGTQPSPCSQCGGSGQVRQTQGFFSISRTCPRCQGAGKMITDPCTNCRGRGVIGRKKSLSIKIPPGVDTGLRLKLENEGEAHPGGLPGDLYVLLEVEPHPLFEREGQDILVNVPISFPQAALGASIEVPTLGGPVQMNLPAGTQSGRVFRLREKGVPRLGGGQRGDELVRVHVEVPSKLNKRQKELLEELGQTLGVESHPAGKSFFDKMKGMFSN